MAENLAAMLKIDEFSPVSGGVVIGVKGMIGSKSTGLTLMSAPLAGTEVDILWAPAVTGPWSKTTGVTDAQGRVFVEVKETLNAAFFKLAE